MLSHKCKDILLLKYDKIYLENYFYSSNNIEINLVIKKYLILKNLELSPEDANYILELFGKNGRIAHTVCVELVRMHAKYDFWDLTSRLTKIRQTLETQAAIGILLSTEFSPSNGSLQRVFELVNLQYKNIKNRIKKYQTLGEICVKILPNFDYFTVIDGGAARTDMLEVFNNIPDSHLNLFLFEPIPELAEIEQKRFSESSVKASILELGLWHEKSTEKISTVGSPSIFPKNQSTLTIESFTQINLDSVNNIFHKEKKDFIDFVKLNIEGSELSALRGMTDFLEDIVLLKTEVKFNHNNESHPKYFEIADFLEKKGFQLIDMARPKYGIPQDFDGIYPNIVSTTDSWLSPMPVEAHWIFMNRRTLKPAKALKKIIALEAYGHLPQAITLFRYLIDTKQVPSHVNGIGSLSNCIQMISENYMSELKRRS